MPAPATIDAFLEVLGKSGLVEAERLRLFLQHNSGLSSTPRKLAARLVAAGLLTQFQAEQLLLGKHRGYSIGKYRILERIGAGGHSTVYLGEHMVVKRRVAIKVLPMARSENPSALARFYREARATGALDHPNLVKAYDVDCDNGLHFLVMDYVDGSSLQQIVARFGPLSIERSAHYIRQAAQGLQAAHAAALVHRDIKPANIILDRLGVIRVLDLGLARFFCDNEDPLTLKYDENSVLGTADYVAPEQALNSHEVDSRADIYSLGATFYFLLSGRPLFPEGQITHKLIWHQTRQPTPLRQLRPEVSPKLSAVVERMLDKARERRYQNVAEVMDALLPWTAEPVPPPSAEEMPRLSPAVRAAMVAEADSGSNITAGRNGWRGDSAEGSDKQPLALQRPRTIAEMATPPFSSGQIDTRTASMVPSQATPSARRRGFAFLNERLVSSILLLVLGIFTGTGIRIATQRDASSPSRVLPEANDAPTERRNEHDSQPGEARLPDGKPITEKPQLE
jgi:eukaryotic-like serine/threonine-protein kinase